MARLINIANQRFNRLTAIKRDPNDPKKWVFRCDCGTVKSINGRNVRRGVTVSCGCRMKETIRDRIEANTTHGHAANGGTPTFHSWNSMKARCTCPTNAAFKDYGGRGIKVCERWLHSFENFIDDMGERPSNRHSLDRWPDNDGDYEPGNCRWATAQEQAMNRRQKKQSDSFRRIEFNGASHTLREWSDILGIKWQTIWWRLQAGLPTEEVLGPPIATRISYMGESLTVKEWSHRIGISIHAIYKRMRAGKSAEEILRV